MESRAASASAIMIWSMFFSLRHDRYSVSLPTNAIKMMVECWFAWKLIYRLLKCSIMIELIPLRNRIGYGS